MLIAVLPEWEVRGGARKHNTRLHAEHTNVCTPRQHFQSYDAQSTDIRSI